MALDVFSTIAARHCKRAFLDRPVDRQVLARALRAAADAPSSRNTQPWLVTVLAGAARDALAEKLCAQFDRGVAAEPDYLNSPAELHGLHAERARAAGAATLAAKGIDRHDPAARRAHLRDNLRFYGAPVAMILHLPGDAVPGYFLATGCFLQNLMLALVASGLGSCPQFSVAGYSRTIKEFLGLPASQIIVCGLAVGYPDGEAPVNRAVPERAPLDEFVEWLDGGRETPVPDQR